MIRRQALDCQREAKQMARGFTLLELMIAITILAALTVFTTSSIQQALKSKEKIQTQIDEMGRVRDALKIMEKDINLAFHYRDLEEEFYAALKKAASPTTSGQSGTTKGGAPNPLSSGSGAAGSTGATGGGGAATGSNNQQANPVTDQSEQIRKANRVNPETQFEGKTNELYFATLNAGRVAAEENSADFIKVAYKVSPCNRLSGSGASTQCLLRYASPWVEGKITDTGSAIVLLENVTEFKLRYFGKGLQDWVSEWSSVESSDALIKSKYPAAVEISLTVENGDKDKKRKISMQIIAPIRFPNNVEKSSTNANAQGGT